MASVLQSFCALSSLCHPNGSPIYRCFSRALLMELLRKMTRFSGPFESSTISVHPVCLHASMAAVFVRQFLSTQVTQRIVNHNTQAVTKANVLTRNVHFKGECPRCINVVVRLSMFPESLISCHGHVWISIVHL